MKNFAKYPSNIQDIWVLEYWQQSIENKLHLKFIIYIPSNII